MVVDCNNLYYIVNSVSCFVFMRSLKIFWIHINACINKYKREKINNLILYNYY